MSQEYEELSKLSVAEMEQGFLDAAERCGKSLVEVRTFFVRLAVAVAVVFVIDWSGVQPSAEMVIFVVAPLFLLALGCTVFMMIAVVAYCKARIERLKYKAMLGL